MKAIMITDSKIISLENVEQVKFITNGSGAKSNPYYWQISVHYTNGNIASTTQFYKKEEASFYFNKIYEILTAE